MYSKWRGGCRPNRPHSLNLVQRCTSQSLSIYFTRMFIIIDKVNVSNLIYYSASDRNAACTYISIRAHLYTVRECMMSGLFAKSCKTIRVHIYRGVYTVIIRRRQSLFIFGETSSTPSPPRQRLYIQTADIASGGGI